MQRLIVIACASLLTASGANAGEAMVVSVRGLALQTTAGASLAIQRMHEAADEFCSGPRRLGRRAAVREMDVTTLKCRRDMTERAVKLLNSPHVTSLQMAGVGTMLASSRASLSP
jgi:UrcA family protein